jgi:DNA excision repair protein ERCC-2
VEVSDPAAELNLFPAAAAVRMGEAGASARQDLPGTLMEPLENALTAAEDWLARNQPAEFREDLLTLYFRLHAFRRTAELYDERYVTIIEEGAAMKVRLFCLDPSRLLREALERGRAAIFFSATLAPLDYYVTLLGGEPEDPVLQLASPFPPENLAVFVQDRIQTRFKGRAESLGEVAAAIGTLVQGRLGNYLVYFPSYHYLNAVLLEFRTRHPSVKVLVQQPGMSEAEREAFLEAFPAVKTETRVGFAVLGGIFGEGIDLVGERLVGAVIVGVGLPQLCLERDLIRDYFQARNGAGFDYAYTFPGMNRVLQAVGRVIRSETDRGVVLLIDARFNEGRYRRLFPAWWRPDTVGNSGALEAGVEGFWKRKETD